MKKLTAIWQLIKSDKYALFTYENAPNDPEWLTAPYFRWNLSSKDQDFINLIISKINNIKNYEV